jgi:pimeloyl-ACP methyl ester carboxylesterase
MEFGSVVDAVRFAVDVQRAMVERNTSVPEDRQITYRIGINIGDIIVEGDDIYGDGVNVAARLEGLAKPGDVYISQTVFHHVRNKVDLTFEDLGEKQVKNIPDPVRVFRVDLSRPGISAELVPIDIRYCQAPDGVGLAYSSAGDGPPLVKAASFMTHLQHDYESVIFKHWVRGLSQELRYIRYDERGNGLSDWEIEDFSFEKMVMDLETVVDAMALERFALLGMSQGASISIAYAHRHPERVSCMIIYGGYASGFAKSDDEDYRNQRLLLMDLIPVTWGKPNPVGRQAYSSLFMPDGTPEEHADFNKLQQITTTPENAHTILQAFSEIDVRGLLPKIRVPTLVLHRRDDAVVPFESGRFVAVKIPDARFVPLEGTNHIVLGNETEWPVLLNEIVNFVKLHTEDA